MFYVNNILKVSPKIATAHDHRTGKIISDMKEFSDIFVLEQRDGRTDKQILDGLVEEYGSEAEKTANKFYEDFFEAIEKATGKSVGFGYTIVDGFIIDGAQGTAGYSHLNISLYSATDETLESSYENVVNTYIHEKGHLATVSLYMQDAEFRKKMDELHAIVKKHDPKGKIYGTTNAKEMITEAFSNPDFQEFLNNIPYKGDKSLWDRLLDALKEVINKIAPGLREDTVLEQVLLTTVDTMNKFVKQKKRITASSRFDAFVLNNINEDGTININDNNRQAINQFAISHGLDIIKKNGKHYVGIKAVMTPFMNDVKDNIFNKYKLVMHMNAKEFPNILYDGDDIRKLYDPTVEMTPDRVLFQRKKYIANIETIEDITDSLGTIIQTPTIDNGGFYMLEEKNPIPYWRATSYLGLSDGSISGGTGRNASRIGNIIDELGKRIFRGDDDTNITREKVVDFVKKESAARLEDEWTKEPIDDAEFERVKNALIDAKEELKQRYGFTKFHVDVVFWDHDERVAGEADVIGEKADGSFTVIDLKTRRKGLDGYDQMPKTKNRKTRYSDKVKHTKQTNLYSDMGSNILNKKFNAPLILMMSPQYQIDSVGKPFSADEIHNTKFNPMTAKGNLVEIIELERTKPESRFDFSDEANEGKGASVGRYVRANRRDYIAWIENIRNKTNWEFNKARTEESISRLQDKFKEVEELINQYIRLTTKTGASPHTQKAKEIISNLEKIIERKMEDLKINDQLIIAEDFFDFSIEEINNLITAASANFVAGDIDSEIDTYNKIKKYRGIFSAAKDIFDEISYIDKDLITDKELLNDVMQRYMELQGLVAKADSIIKAKQKSLVVTLLKNNYLGSKAEIKYRDELISKYEGEGYTTQEAKDLTRKEMSTEEFRKKLAKEYAAEIDELVTSVQNDIDTSTLWLLSDVSINNPFIQLLHTMLMQAKQRFSTVVNSELQELDRKRREWNLTREEQQELIVRDKDDNAYFVSEYSIEFKETYEAKLREIRKMEAELVPGSEDYNKQFNLVKRAKQELKKWVATNTEFVNQRRRPIAKWQSKEYQKLSAKQKEALEYIISKLEFNDESRIGIRKLGEYRLGVMYYRLPGVLKTKWERLSDKDAFSGLKKAFNELTSVEKDDEDFGDLGDSKDNGIKVKRVYADLESKPIKTVPVHFRKKLGAEQSTDIFSVLALEVINGIRYSIDLETSRKGQLLHDFVDSKKFNQTVGFDKTRIMSIFAKKDSTIANKIDGDASNVSKAINKMLNNQVYSIMHETTASVNLMGKEFEINRLTSSITGYTAFANMTFKLTGATTNLITGMVATMIESVGGEFFTAKDMARAAEIYAANLSGIAADIGNTVKRNKVNQMMKFFDVESELGHLDSRFERGEHGGLLDMGTLLGLQSMGEHNIHAMLMLSILEGTKLTNKAGDYLNANGEVVSTIDESASVIHAFEMKNGVLTVKDWAKKAYTTFDTMVPLGKGGFGNLRALIKDRVVRTQGAFGKDTQSLLDRYWYGKLLKQFKKHIIPQTLNRFRGLNHAFVDRAELHDQYKYYNYHSKTEEYGYYVSFLRFLSNVVKEAKWGILQYKTVGEDTWNTKMTIHERANVKKTVTEISYMSLMALLAGMLRAGLEDDDDNWWMYQALYLANRQISDAGLAYYDPSEAWRLTETPAAALRSITNIASVLSLLLPWNWSELGDTYKGGYRRGQNKAWAKIKRATILGDIDKQFDIGFSKTRFQNENSK